MGRYSRGAKALSRIDTYRVLIRRYCSCSGRVQLRLVKAEKLELSVLAEALVLALAEKLMRTERLGNEKTAFYEVC